MQSGEGKQPANAELDAFLLILNLILMLDFLANPPELDKKTSQTFPNCDWVNIMASLTPRLILGLCSVLVTAVLLSSCSSTKPKRPPKLKKITGLTQYLDGSSSGAPRFNLPPVEIESWWKGDGVTGSPKVIISLGEQKAYFYKGETVVGLTSISSGEERYPTPKGTYSIIQKNVNHRSGQYGDYVDAEGNVVAENIERGVDPMPKGSRYRGASMPYFMRFIRGVGMHAGYLPGYPASHGCVRMPDHMAETFFNNVSLGTPVIVKN